MNRETRDKFASGTDQTDLTSGNSCWETAPLVFKKLNEDFGPFDVDLFADAARHLVEKWLGPGWMGPNWRGSEDALTIPWHCCGTRGYGNPPYGHFVQQMLPYAKEQTLAGFESTLLLPLRVTKAFTSHVLQGASELWFPDKRLVFFENGAPRCSVDKKGRLHADTALFDSVIVRYVPGWRSSPTVHSWKVPKHVTVEDLERAAQRMREKEEAA